MLSVVGVLFRFFGWLSARVLVVRQIETKTGSSADCYSIVNELTSACHPATLQHYNYLQLFDIAMLNCMFADFFFPVECISVTHRLLINSISLSWCQR